MSTLHTAPETTTTTEPTPPPRRRSLPRWLPGGTVAAGVLAAVAIAAWPASATDEARADGEQFGEAVAHLYSADTTEEVDAALAETSDAAADVREHAGDNVADHVAEQEDALARAADGAVGMYQADDEFEQDLYQLELEDALADLENEAVDFRAEGPEVQQAFWEGYETGFENE